MDSNRDDLITPTADQVEQFLKDNSKIATVPEISPDVPILLPKENTPDYVTPSSIELIKKAQKDIKEIFGLTKEIPEPPEQLFETMKNFHGRGIDFEVYYQPGLSLSEESPFWEKEGTIKPQKSFWQQIEDGNFPRETATLEEGWVLAEKIGKPTIGQEQKADYLAPLMKYLRDKKIVLKAETDNHIQLPDTSRLGVTHEEVEEIILPAFQKLSGAKGIVRCIRYMEYIARLQVHPEWRRMRTWHLFADQTQGGAERLVGGAESAGGPEKVYSDTGRNDSIWWSPVVFFPSQKT